MTSPTNLPEAQGAGNWHTFLGGASIEISARDPTAPKVLADRIERGTRVHVSFLQNADYLETVASARALSREGFIPVPHIAARSLVSEGALLDYLARLSGEASVNHALLIGGDLDKQRGPYADSLSVLETGALQRSGIRSVAFAGHPEGHPAVDNAVLIDALRRKIDTATRVDLASSIITQVCFEAEPILSWLTQIRRLGIAAPVSIGAASPISPATMMRFAIRCGVGPSIRALTTQRHRLGKLLTEEGPETLIQDIAAAINTDRDDALGAIGGMHFFVFGSVAKAADWLRNQQRGSAP